jgi:hypothetical protein
MTSIVTTDVTELIPTEKIGLYIQAANLPPNVALAIAWAEPGQGSIAVRFPRWDSISVPAGTKTEGSDFTQVVQTTAESSITPGIVGFEEVFTDEVLVQTVKGPAIAAGAIDNGLRFLAQRLEVDLLASSTSATNATGATTDVFGKDKYAAALAAWRALEVPQIGLGTAMVLDHGPMADLEVDMLLSVAPSSGMFAGLMSAENGYKGRAPGGVELFESGNVAAEAPGMSNFITKIGNQASGLGIVFQEMPRVVGPNVGVLGARSAQTFYVLRAWYGCGLTNPGRLLEVLTAA